MRTLAVATLIVLLAVPAGAEIRPVRRRARSWSARSEGRPWGAASTRRIAAGCGSSGTGRSTSGTSPLFRRLAAMEAGNAGAPIGWYVALRSEAMTPRAFKAAAICAPEPASTALGVAAMGTLAALSRARRTIASSTRKG